MKKHTEKSAISLRRVINTVLPFVSLALLLCLWLYASSVNSVLVPTPKMTWDRLVQLFVQPISGYTIFGHVWASLRRVLIALFFSTTLGIFFGIMIGWSKTLNAIFGTLFELIRPIPPIAWLPIVIVWFGIGEFPKIVIVFIGSFMSIVINTATGIKMVQPLLLDVGRMFNANNRQLLMEVAIPSALPAIFAGFRNGTSGGWMTVLAAEMIGANAGLGFLIYQGMQFFDIPLIIVGMLAIGIVGTLISVVTDYSERWVCPWTKKQASD